MTPIIAFALGIAYVLFGIFLMVTIDGLTSRISVFIRRKDARGYLLLAFWPVLLWFVFLPKYQPRRQARVVGLGKPFHQA